MSKTIAERIKHLHPCDAALKWSCGYTSPAKAWKECHRGDWMLWLIGKSAGPPESRHRRKLVLCAVECARLALPIYETRQPNDDRVRKCLDTAELWANGKATIDELREARNAAAAADADADAYAAAAAAAAAYADAADAAAAAAADAADAYAADARSRVLAQCADIVRKYYPKPPKVKKRLKAA